MRLLMVENHALFAQHVAQQFLRAHEVVVVPSLAQAREQLHASTFDAVLVDYDLDDGKGAELVREMRGAGYSGRVIGMSSHEWGNSELVAAGANDACPKGAFARIEEYLLGKPG